MPDVHDKPCLVEAHDREVIVECGTNIFSLTPAAASYLGTRLVSESIVAQQQEPGPAEDDR